MSQLRLMLGNSGQVTERTKLFQNRELPMASGAARKEPVMEADGRHKIPPYDQESNRPARSQQLMHDSDIFRGFPPILATK